MKQTHDTALRRGLAGAALAGGALALALVGGTAASAGAGAAAPATITMKFERGKFSFEGASRVRAGRKLRIRNDTNPERGGPHSFTLVKKSLLPESRSEQRQCFDEGICGPVAAAHEASPESEEIGRPLVKVGKPGWDRPFARGRRGDSWFTAEEGATFSQKVSARAGRTLYYFCVIHPEMQGKIKVVGRR